MKILCGDIGATNCRLALAECDEQGVLRLEREQRHPSRDYAGLEAVLQVYLQGLDEPPGMACFGVAGPVRDGVCRTTNLPWELDAELIAEACGLEQVFLLNDLEATAWGVEAVPEERRLVLHDAEPMPEANQAVIAAGTGLGEAGRVWCVDHYRAFGSEGAHADFGPGNALEMVLFNWLQARYGHVSWERVASGPALRDIHEFLLEYREAETSPTLSAAMAEKDPSAAIAEAGLDGSDELCAEALHIFVRCYGAEAGNHALKLNALGGVFIAGGIAPKLKPLMASAPFMDAFFDKGRMEPLMRGMPVVMLEDDDTAIKGAALYLLRRMDAE